MRGAVFPFHGLGIDLPDLCRAFAQGGDDLVGRLRHHDRGSKQHAAAAGQVGEADGGGVADQNRDAAIVDAKQLGADVGDRRARAADIGMAGGDDDVAVLGDVDLRRGFAAGVEPEAGGDAPALQFPERRPVMRMRLCGFERLDIADARKHRAVRGFGALVWRRSSAGAPADPSSALRRVRPSRTPPHKHRSARPARDRPRPWSGWKPRRTPPKARAGYHRAQSCSRPRRGSASPAKRRPADRRCRALRRWCRPSWRRS